MMAECREAGAEELDSHGIPQGTAVVEQTGRLRNRHVPRAGRRIWAGLDVLSIAMTAYVMIRLKYPTHPCANQPPPSRSSSFHPSRYRSTFGFEYLVDEVGANTDKKPKTPTKQKKQQTKKKQHSALL